jgi:hypothetical protein
MDIDGYVWQRMAGETHRDLEPSVLPSIVPLPWQSVKMSAIVARASHGFAHQKSVCSQIGKNGIMA